MDEVELRTKDEIPEEPFSLARRRDILWKANKNIKTAIEVAILFVLIIFCAIYWGIVPANRSIKYCPDTIGLTVFFGVLLFLLVAFYLTWLLVIRHFVRMPGSKLLFKIGPLDVTAIDIAMISAISFAAVVCIVVFGIQTFMMSNTIPSLNGTLKFPGKLQDTVKIHREENGMIHIVAQNDHDLYFAQGVASAQDRLFQMEFQRRAASGTLSAVVGEAGLSIDKYFRTVNFYGSLTGIKESLSQETRDAITAYVDGVNAYLDSKPPLQLEFRLLGFEPAPWTFDDVIVWGKMLSNDLSLNSEHEIIRLQLLIDLGIIPERVDQLYQRYDSNSDSILSTEELEQSGIFSENSSFQVDFQAEYARLKQYQINYAKKKRSQSSTSTSRSVPTNHADRIFQEFSKMKKRFHNPEASNNWIISGSRTSSGKPMLANDPHLSLRLPMIWIMMHLQTPNNDVTGACFAGVPFVVIGRNEFMSWGVTNSGADVQDLYIVDEDPQDETKYWANGQLLSYVQRKEIIKIKGKDDLVFPCLDTVFGPVANEYVGNAGDLKIVLRWVVFEPNDTSVETLHRINLARNWTMFVDALKLLGSPSQNFVYADPQGNIGYYVPGKIPIRNPDHSGNWPVNTNGSFTWNGYIPFDELPHVLNPDKGYLSSANQMIAGKGYPYWLTGDPSDDRRGRRIAQMIESKGNNIDLDFMKSIQQDFVTLMKFDLKNLLISMKIKSRDSNTAGWIDTLINWDGNLSVDSKEATVFELWYAQLTTLAGKETNTTYWDMPYYIVNALHENSSDPNCVSFEGGCVGWALDQLDQVLKMKDSEKSYGDLHHVAFYHAVLGGTALGCLYNRFIPHGGDRFTPNVGAHDYETFEMTKGPSYRQIVDWSNVESSVMIYPIGQSGSPHSDRYDNYMSMWQSGEYILQKTKNFEQYYTCTLEA